MESSEIHKDRCTLATVTLVLTLVLIVAGCIEYPSGSDDVPGPFRIRANIDCYMVDVGRWDAMVFLSTWGEEANYPLVDIFLDGGLMMGNGSLGPSYEFNDTYGDDILNDGVTIEMFNLTEQHLTSYNITWKGQSLGEFTLEWNYNDLGAYLISVNNYPTKLVGDGLYRVVNPVIQVRNPSLLKFDDLDISYVSVDGDPLDPVDILYTDMDGNGFLSKGDTMEVTNLTIEYERGQIFYKVSGHLVGRSHLGEFFGD